MKVKIHPLFPIALAVYTLLGGVKNYLLSLFAVLIHESAHYATARLVGARPLSVTLLPYGASMRLPEDTPRFGAVLAAGPFSNLMVAALALSACWIMPECYGVLKGFIGANAMIATLNLLPAYPLDGGRLVRVLFKGRWARIVTDLCTLSAGVFAALFFFRGGNVGVLIFSLFMLSYFLLFCLGRVNKVRASDPLFALVKTDEEGRILPALLHMGKRRFKLSSAEITRLCVLYPQETSIGEALRREEGFHLGYK